MLLSRQWNLFAKTGSETSLKFERQLQKELSNWQEKHIITPEQAERIGLLHPVEKKLNYNIIHIIFAVIGALLIGGGIILIFASNWDNLPIWLRTGLAFLPLVIGQGITAFILLRKIKSEAWREGTGVFHSIGVYACIAMIGQIYQLPGSFSEYILLCSMLILPVCYALNATVPLLLYMIGIVVWQPANLLCLALFTFAAPHIYLKL